jgi:hypothetical protein
MLSLARFVKFGDLDSGPIASACVVDPFRDATASQPAVRLLEPSMPLSATVMFSISVKS